MNINFEYYKVFYYVSKYGSLTRAASVLMTSQPAVTRTIHNLENELGCRLFIRSKTGVELTPEGRRFYDYVSTGCAQFFRGEDELTGMLSLENGTIYISATETALHCVLLQAMERFQREYPRVRFKILNHSTTESIHVLREGKVDLAVTSAPFKVTAPLKTRDLGTYRDVLIGGSRYRELSEKERSLEELSACSWISLTSDAITRNFLNEYFEEHGLTFVPDIELATTDMILPAVRHNLGIGFLPEAFARADLAAGTVHEIKVAETLPERSITLIYDEEYPQSTASRMFQKFLRK